jgi:hypothetical protein
LASTINEICSEIDIIRCPPVHTISKDRIPEIFSLLSQTDIVLHQPISESFGVISSNSILSRFPGKTYLSFPSIYFSGLFPQLGYLRLPSGGTLVGPLGEYHDMRILRAFQNKIPPKESIELISNDDFCYRSHYISSFAESKNREASTDISVMSTIEALLPERPCFYTFNHPDNLVLYHIATAALARLGVPYDSSKPPRIRPFLDNIIAPIPRSIISLIGANWSRSFYSSNGNRLEFADLVHDFYDLYTNVPDLSSLVESNKRRISIPANWPTPNQD